MNPTPVSAVLPAFLNNGGELGALMRGHDWSASPLGHPDTWPQSLRTVVELLLNSKFPMFVAWGPELGFLYNDAYTAVLGDKHPAALGKPFYEIWSEIWSDISPLIDRALQGEATFRDRLLLTMRRHGYDEPTWFTFSYSPVRDESGTVAGMYCACVEETDQVLAERYREEEYARLRTLFEQAPGFMAILRGPDHVFDLTNEAYSQLVGHRPVLGKAVREALPELLDQRFLSLLDHVYTTGETHVGHSAAIRLQRTPGAPLEERFVDFIYQPILDARGQVTGIFSEGSDVTERKLAEEELRQLAADLAKANRRQSEFLATLAHELRNPLAPIRTGLDLMRLADHNSESASRIRGMMERQVDHLVHLVDELLDVARINTGKIEIKKSRVLLKDIVLSAVETTLPGIEAKRMEFSVQLPDEAIWLDADFNRLAQVISNVLTNARKYTPEGGKIRLSVHCEDMQAVITVVDNGIGIPAESMSQIFDMFTQVGHGIDHAQGGLGIGLSLVKRLTEKHGGTVHVSSEGPGKGSSFSIRLPVARIEPVAKTAQQESASATPRKHRPMRVLIADDNRDAAELLRAMLEMQGHAVQIVHDGESALALARSFRPDLALLDIGMPVMNGYELARAMRKLPELQGTRLAAITGWGAREDRERSSTAGFDHHLVKPVHYETLNRLLADTLP